MKKLFSLVLAGAMVLSLAACGGNESGASASSASSASSAASSGTGEVAGLSEAIAEEPILLTSGGQSADYAMVGAILDNLGMEYTSIATATSADLGDNKTLIVGVGGSSKGLGAAGIDEDEEIARLDELLSAAKDAGVTIIAMHTGGSARRGDLSDKFIAPVFENADYTIVVSSGDEDGLMEGICAEQGIPMDKIESIGDVATVLPNAFK